MYNIYYNICNKDWSLHELQNQALPTKINSSRNVYDNEITLLIDIYFYE